MRVPIFLRCDALNGYTRCNCSTSFQKSCARCHETFEKPAGKLSKKLKPIFIVQCLCSSIFK
jgi:hypothetical protein